MTSLELKNFIRATLIATRSIAQEITVFDEVIDFITSSLNTGIPAWTNALTFNTDGTGAGSFCTYPDTNGALRFWKTKTSANINNAPPTNPATTESTYWIEVSPSSGSAIKEWAPGLFGTGYIVVGYNPGGGDLLYKLAEPTRPFLSEDFDAEFLAGKWVALAPTTQPNVAVDCGDHDASTDLFPTTGGTGVAGAIRRANFFYITVAGTLGGTDVEAGARIMAKVDSPGQTLANWFIDY